MSNKLSDALVAIWKYSQQVPELSSFLADNQETAIRVVRDLSKINKGLSFSEWKEQARAEMIRLGIKGQTEWQNLLLNLGYETLKGEQAKPWFKKMFGWFTKVKDFLVRNGLNTFIEGYTKQVTSYLLSELKNPDITFKGLTSGAFAFIKTLTPNSPDTFVALVVDLAVAVLRARTGVQFPQ